MTSQTSCCYRDDVFQLKKKKSQKSFEKQCKFEMQKIEKLRDMCTELVNQITDKDDTQRDTSGKRCESD